MVMRMLARFHARWWGHRKGLTQTSSLTPTLTRRLTLTLTLTLALTLTLPRWGHRKAPPVEWPMHPSDYGGIFRQLFISMHRKGLPALARCFGLWYAPALEWMPRLRGRVRTIDPSPNPNQVRTRARVDAPTARPVRRAL